MQQQPSNNNNNNHNQAHHQLTKIPIICRVFRYVKSSGPRQLTGNMVTLAGVTSTWRDALVSWAAAVPSWSHALHTDAKPTHIHRLFFAACERALLWIVDSLIRAGVKRDEIMTTHETSKNYPLHLALLHGSARFHQLHPNAKAGSNNNKNNINSNHFYSEERHAVVETLLSTELLPSLSNRMRRKFNATHGAPIDPVQMATARGTMKLSAFELAVELGLEPAFDLMFGFWLTHVKSATVVITKPLVQSLKMNPLLRAIAHGTKSTSHQNIAKKMISSDVFFDRRLLHHRDHWRMSLLHHAARAHNHEICKMLVDRENELINAKGNKNNNNNDGNDNDEDDDESSTVSSYSYPDDALYAQRKCLLFMQDERGELPLTSIFSGGSQPPSTAVDRSLRPVVAYVHPDHPSRPRFEGPQDLENLFQTFRVLCAAYKQNRDERFPNAQKYFLYPNRLPGIASIDSNTSIISIAMNLFEFGSETLIRALEFLLTEPQKFGFDKIDINEYDSDCRTPLLAAVGRLSQWGSIDSQNSVTELMIRTYGADPNQLVLTNFGSPAPFSKTFSNYRTEYVTSYPFTASHHRPHFLLINAIAPTISDSLDPGYAKLLQPILNFVCYASSSNAIQFLVKLGADPHGCSPLNKVRPIHRVAGEGYQHTKFPILEEIFEKLLRGGDEKNDQMKKEKVNDDDDDDDAANEKTTQRRYTINKLFDCKDSNGITPLMYAIQAGSFETAKKLIIKYKVDVNAVDEEGHNAFHWMYKPGGMQYYDMFDVIARSKCDIELKDKQGKTPTDLGKGVTIVADRIAEIIEKAKKLNQEGFQNLS